METHTILPVSSGPRKKSHLGASVPWTPLIFLFIKQSKSQAHSRQQAMTGGTFLV